MRRNSESPKWLIWSIVFLAVFVLGLFGYSTWKEMHRKKQVEKEIETLKREAEKIEKENMALEEKISYFGSKDYQEMQAKDKLHLQSPDENVVVIAQGPVKFTENPAENDAVPERKLPAESPNFKKWLNYFFN